MSGKRGQDHGDVEEAIKIAALFEAMGAFVTVEDDAVCASACALIFITSPIRFTLAGRVILHRPYYDSNLLKDVSSITAIRGEREAIALTKSFLADRGVPSRLIEAMASTPSSEGYELNDADQIELGFLSQSMHEMALAKCQPNIPKDAPALLDCAGAAGMDLRKEAIGKLVGKAQLAQAMRAMLLESGATEHQDGTMSLPGKPSKSAEPQRYGKNLDDHRAKPEDQKKSDTLFEVWVQRAKLAGVAVDDPVDPMKRFMYTVNKLLPALARLGNDDAMMGLGIFAMDTGDILAARAWFVMAAEYGNSMAPYLVHTTYESKENFDLIRSYAWAILAVPGTGAEARSFLAFRGLTMTPAQKDEAKDLANRLATKIQKK